MNYMRVVEKVWGEERWVVNRRYCGKIMVLKKGFRCSMHYHKKKDETFFLNKGKTMLELEGKKIIMEQGDIEIIEPGQKHRFTGLEDSEIIEFSTTHDDADSYREEPSGKVKL